MSERAEKLAKEYANDKHEYFVAKEAFIAGYDAAFKELGINPDVKMPPKLQEQFDAEFKPGPWAYLFEKKDK
jgi:hypothetical protein